MCGTEIWSTRKEENKHRSMRALFTSKNLIGDALYIQPSLSAWAEQHPDWDIDLLTLNDHITCLYSGMGIKNLRTVFEPEGPYDFEHKFDVSAAFKLGETDHVHIAEGYARGLGVEIPKNPRVRYTPPEGDSIPGLILLSMFSNSCASREGKPANKMLSWAHWLPILILARQAGPVGVLGGPKDEAPLGLKESEYLTGLTLPKVARIIRDAQLLITIDNGMGHLAASQGTPTVLFYPACLTTSWIVPSGNSRMVVCHMDPMVITTNQAMGVVRQGLKKIWRPREEEKEEGQEAGSGGAQEAIRD